MFSGKILLRGKQMPGEEGGMNGSRREFNKAVIKKYMNVTLAIPNVLKRFPLKRLQEGRERRRQRKMDGSQ